MGVFDNYDKVTKKFMPAFKSSAANVMTKEFGITQQKAAVLLGVTQAAISKYINGRKRRHSDIKIGKEDIKAFVERVSRNDIKGGQRILCKVCQENAKFSCALMTK